MIGSQNIRSEPMKYLLVVLLACAFAGATTISDYESKSINERSAIVSAFIDKMTTDLRAQNPQMATDIRAWFTEKQAGKPLSEGAERLVVELLALDTRARDGRADLSKIQIESVIVYIVKQNFAPLHYGH
jgi:hypothetical protein